MVREYQITTGAMRNSGSLLLFVALTIPAFAADPPGRQSITVAQLEQNLSASHASDRDVARRLSGFELVQCLSGQRRAHLAATLPGEQSRAALNVLADFSQFLDPPVDEIVPTFPPDAPARVQIFNRVVAFVESAMHNMPNLLATRDTSRFESYRHVTDTGQSILVKETPFRPADHGSVTVLYRDGTEVVETGASKVRSRGLNSWGEFGPLLGVIVADMLKGKVVFHHWEQTPAGRLAVFDFEVPKDQSHYVVRYCCRYTSSRVDPTLQLQPAYHGRVAIDTSSGAILRMVLSADLQPADIITRADVAIEYGPVELGGKTYICPLRSVALSVAGTAALAGLNVIGVTALNHTAFEDYHLFRGDMRLVPDAEPKQP
jgi:hypothetical protein